MSARRTLPREGVLYCGVNSPKSFDGNIYFVQHADGNRLRDAPKIPAISHVAVRGHGWASSDVGPARTRATHLLPREHRAQDTDPRAVGYTDAYALLPPWPSPLFPSPDLGRGCLYSS